MRRRSVKILAISALVVVLIIVIYGAISWVFSDKLTASNFAPLGPVDVTAFGLPQPENVTIPGDGVSLAGWYFANPRKAGCAVVMLHGYSGSRQEILAAAPIFWDRGCDLLMYDSRGHGESSPALLTYGAHERQDLRLAVEWLAQRTGLPHNRIGLIGWSYGAAVALQAAAQVHDLAFVIADSSYSSLGDIARAQAVKQFGAWARVFVPGALLISGLRAGFDARTVAPDSAIRDVQAPVLLIHSRQDGFTPVVQSERIFAHSNKSRTEFVIPDWEAPHANSYTNNPAAYTAVVDSFLNKYAPGFGTR